MTFDKVHSDWEWFYHKQKLWGRAVNSDVISPRFVFGCPQHDVTHRGCDVTVAVSDWLVLEVSDWLSSSMTSERWSDSAGSRVSVTTRRRLLAHRGRDSRADSLFLPSLTPPPYTLFLTGTSFFMIDDNEECTYRVSQKDYINFNCFYRLQY